MNRLRFGIAVPNSGPLASRKAIRETAEKAEELGFDLIWVHDHISYGKDWLGHRASGTSEQISSETEPYMYESLSTLSFLAGFTKSIELGTGILVLPLRNPLVLGRQLITLQELSGDRLVLGIGIGDYPAEFKVMGVPYERRAEIAEEYVEVMRKIFRAGTVTHHGRFLSFEDAQFYPKVKPPPILHGGGVLAVPEPLDDKLVMPVLRRVARLGDGWMPDWGRPELIAQGIRTIGELARGFGREAYVNFRVAFSTLLHLADTDEEAMNRTAASIEFAEKEASVVAKFGRRTTKKNLERSLVGSPKTVTKKIEKYRECGVTDFKLNVLTSDLGSLFKMMEKFAKQVMSSF